VLNLCRALAYLREGAVLSKCQGGEWGLKNLPNAHQGVIQAALNAYQSGRDMFYDREQAEDFCYDAMEELNG
jgi:streptomycin 3"-adenylyltransferase